MTALAISNIVLWLVVIGLVLVLLALTRQLGVLHERIAPKIGEVVRRVETDPRLAKLWAERFPLRQS